MRNLCRDLTAFGMNRICDHTEVGHSLIVNPDLIGQCSAVFLYGDVGHGRHTNATLDQSLMM
jgi:hypothetical protein